MQVLQALYERYSIAIEQQIKDTPANIVYAVFFYKNVF